MIVFLVALRDTMAHEYTPERVDFFLHFGAASLVWFIYLPVFRQIYRVLDNFYQQINSNHQIIYIITQQRSWKFQIVAGIALRISKLWRTKFLIGIIYSADTFAYIVLMHLLWPSRSEQYYLLAIEVIYVMQNNVNGMFSIRRISWNYLVFDYINQLHFYNTGWS